MEEQIVPAITQVKLTAEREHMSLIKEKRKRSKSSKGKNRNRNKE